MKVLVVSNCQAFGFANSFQSLADDIDATALTIREMQQRQMSERVDLADGFDHRFIHPSAVDLFPDSMTRDRTTVLPSITFAGYHPDLIYLHEDGQVLNGPLGDYHSAIAFVAFRHAIPLANTVRLYSRAVYDLAGYFDGWVPAKERLLSAYASVGMPIEEEFYEWTRGGPFMHAVNHPKINVIASVAAAALERLGVKSYPVVEAIPDNLMNGPIFPVYPEIAEALGVSGSMRFKPPGARPGTARTWGLSEYVERSFGLLANGAARRLEPAPPFVARVAAVEQAVLSERGDVGD
jgi:hypothetical protein